MTLGRSRPFRLSMYSSQTRYGSLVLVGVATVEKCIASVVHALQITAGLTIRLEWRTARRAIEDVARRG